MGSLTRPPAVHSRQQSTEDPQALRRAADHFFVSSVSSSSPRVARVCWRRWYMIQAASEWNPSRFAAFRLAVEALSRILATMQPPCDLQDIWPLTDLQSLVFRPLRICGRFGPVLGLRRNWEVCRVPDSRTLRAVPGAWAGSSAVACPHQPELNYW